MIPPRVQCFLWLLSNNRLLTRDNLAKRRDVSDPSCIFCAEPESITHLFFSCCVARNIWRTISDLLGFEIGANFKSVALFWVSDKRHKLTNVVSSSIIWALWKLRNEIYFQGAIWTGMKKILLKIVRMLRRWIPLFKEEMQARIEEFSRQLETRASLPPHTVVEGGNDELFFRVGSISCSAFGYKCSFGAE